MPANLRQLKNGLRLKLGELSDGTWGTFDYNEQGLFDEYEFAINLAQDNLARDMYNPESYPLTKTALDKSIVSNATFYSLPSDFLAMERVEHFRYNRTRPVLPGSIKNTKWGYDHGYSGYYRHYEVRGRMNSYVASGVTSSASDNQVIDNRGNFTSVRLQDIVYNLTDGSEAIVTDFNDGFVTFDKLIGGMRNEFAKGDSYAIGTAEATQWMLFVDPPTINSNTILYNGPAVSFTPTKSGIVQEVYVTHESLPEGWTDESTASYSITKDDSTLASESPRSEAGSENIRVGENEIAFQPFQMEAGETYHVQCKIDVNEFDPVPDSNVLPLANVRLELQSSDKLILSYARRPRRLVRDESICEFPNECLSALYQGAANILLEKISDNGVTPKIFLDKYEYELNKIESFFSKKDESGAFEIGIDGDGQYIDYLHQSQSDEHIWTSEFW